MWSVPHSQSEEDTAGAGDDSDDWDRKSWKGRSHFQDELSPAVSGTLVEETGRLASAQAGTMPACALHVAASGK